MALSLLETAWWGATCVAPPRALPPHLLVRGQPCGRGAPGDRPTPLLRASFVGAGVPGSSERGRRPSLRGTVGFSRLRRPSFWKGPPRCGGRNFHPPALGWGILLGWHPRGHPTWELSGGGVLVPAGPGAAAAESEGQPNPFLPASPGYASNFKGKGVQVAQKADPVPFYRCEN